MHRGRERRAPTDGRPVLIALGALLLGGLGALTIWSPASARDPAMTLGLQRSDASGPCAGYGYELRLSGGGTACTHGPDPAPDGIEVTSPRSIDELRADLATTDRVMPRLVAESTPGTGQVAAAAGGIPCVGYGSAGPRVQAIYAHLDTATSRYAEVAPLIRGWARQTDDIFDASAGQTAGSRHLRWVHSAVCTLAVAELELSETAAVDLNRMMDEMAAAGYNRSDRRYMVWFDTNVLCGVAVNVPDDRPGQDNPNNVSLPGITHFGRVDTPCWGVPAPENQVEAHEIMHTLGAVQFSSPYSSSVSRYEIYGHCIDEYDTMCYEDGTPKSMIFPCPESNERFFDCRHDDYFHTNPSATNYLATHWNSAMSRFLVRVDPVAGFLDVSSSPFREDIRWIGTSGITTGCSADGERYCESTVVTRGQMASFLARALGLPAATRDFFTDDETSVHEADINRVAAAHIAAGCGTGRFCPAQSVTREQMASFLARALDLPAAAQDYFTDDERSVHEASINRVAAAGIAAGCGGGRYCPTQTVTRGQMAAFLRRAFS